MIEVEKSITKIETKKSENIQKKQENYLPQLKIKESPKEIKVGNRDC